MTDQSPPRLGRFRFMDAQRVNLDGFATPDPALGMVAVDSPADPTPSLVLQDGEVIELDGRERGPKFPSDAHRKSPPWAVVTVAVGGPRSRLLGVLGSWRDGRVGGRTRRRG